MAWKFLDALRGILRREPPKPAPEPEREIPGPHLNRYHTFGANACYGPGEGPDVVFLYPEKGIRRVIVNEQGEIENFPGLSEDAARRTGDVRFDRHIRFRTDFEHRWDGKLLMIWEIQPDGCYYGDDGGFGMEHGVEIRLYALIDERGEFTGPFEIYNIDLKYYYQAPPKPEPEAGAE